MKNIEPLSVVSAVVALLGFLMPGSMGVLLLLAGAILLAFSYRRFKKNQHYVVKWPMYVAAGVVWLAIVLRLVMLLAI